MTGRLAEILADALRSASGPVKGIGTEDVGSQALLASASTHADRLGSLGLAADEPVLVAVRNAPADIGALLGVWRAGGVAVPVHAAAAPATRKAVEGATGARWLLRDGQVEPLSALPPPARPLLRGAALVIFTSGSTGKPKGVVIGHEPFAGKLAVLGRLLRFSPADTVVVPLQLTFIFGLWTSFLALLSGARLELVSRFSAEAAARALERGGTVFATVPSMLRAILAEARPSAPGLRLILTGGEPLGPALAAALGGSFAKAGVYDLYGLTETGSCDFRLAPEEAKDGAGTIGVPTEGVAFRIAGPDGTAADGQAGELQIRTPFGMLGYLDQPDLTASSYVDRFFRTGDLARIRPDGRVELVGRSKEIISRGGNKIAPLEIDNLLCSHPAVAAALCAGVPDARLGEAVHAVVVPKAGVLLRSEDLRTWISARVERFKVPDVIEIASTLPTGPTGKASRTALTERATMQRALASNRSRSPGAD